MNDEAAPSPRYRQHVGRPELVEPGDLPPWDALSNFDPAALGVGELRRAVIPLDPVALVALAPVSAVLVPIVERAGALAVLLTRRSPSLALDPGNVSFPGGHLEPGEHPLDAALREAEEEIALSPAEVEVLGTLELVERSRDGQRVAVIVGLVRGDPALQPNEDEVAALLEVPLSLLYDPQVAWEERWGAGRRPVRFFAHPAALGDDLVWGLTARVLWDLLARLCEDPGNPRGAR